MIAQRWRRGLKDVGDQALMRGWLPQVRVCVRGVPYLTAGVGDAGHKAADGSSPAVASPPPLRADGGEYVD